MVICKWSVWGLEKLVNWLKQQLCSCPLYTLQWKKTHLTDSNMLSKNPSVIAACCVTVMSVISSVWRLKYLDPLTLSIICLKVSCAITFSTAVALVQLHLKSHAMVQSGNIDLKSLVQWSATEMQGDVYQEFHFCTNNWFLSNWTKVWL